MCSMVLSPRVGVTTFSYEAPGFGVGALWLDGDRVVWHELPSAGGARGTPGPDGRTHPLVRRLCAYFAGEPVDLDGVELDLEDYSPFFRQLATTLRRVPRGSVVSYGELAALAGRPSAQRAAGTFCARNRHPIFVPCHRVVGADGVGSYGALGTDYKLRLLALEGWTPS
jgi:methylated-DNA-[protein]-cysteine S-methyltransferase